MLRWIITVLAALAAIVIAVAVVGALLPAEHVARASITLQQPADSVWAVVRDLGDYPSWWSDVDAMERLPDREGHETWTQKMDGEDLPLMVVESEPPARMVTRIAGQDLLFGGSWTQEIEPAPEGCTVTVTEAGEVYNPIVRVVARFIIGHHRTIESYLRALSQRFGEEADITRVGAS
jgi:hypothetical protein